MNIVFEFANTFFAEVRGQKVKVDVTKLPVISHAAIYEYGLQRVLNDAAGKAGKKPEEAALESVKRNWLESAVACAQAKLDALYSGQLDSRGVADPIREEMIDIARLALQKAGKWPKDQKDRNTALSALVNGPKAEILRSKAEANIKARSEAADDLGLDD